MAIKLSNLVSKQLPEFITTQYDTFALFLEKYYESLEITGQPLDILFNLTNYYDINFYEKYLLESGSILVGNLSLTSDEITLENAGSFPDEYGYVKIGQELCFYETKEGNTLKGVKRGVSGTTKLGDLYNKSQFESTQAANHFAGDKVSNISNLFLFAIVKSFERQYLASFPEKYLKEGVDKRTLIKNITDFYKAKGSEKSIQFIFNTLVSENPREEVFVKRPADQTLKSSVSDWISNYTVSIKVISGNPLNLIGQEIIQQSPYASFVVDNVVSTPENVILLVDKTSVNGEFSNFAFTTLVKPITSSTGQNLNLEVVSTKGWKNSNSKLYIGSEEFTISERNINQFKTSSRSGSNTYPVGTEVYSKAPLYVNGVKFFVSGNVYNLESSSKQPYALPNTKIVNSTQRSSKNPIVYDFTKSDYRWIKNNDRERPSVYFSNTSLQNKLSKVNADVSAILEDSSYFYICSSGYPSTSILTADDTGSIGDNNYLKLIRKNPVATTENYSTGSYDVGILLDGTLAYSKISNSFVKYGKIETVTITNKGSGYKAPPVVLVNGAKQKAKAILSGGVISDIEIVTTQTYRRTPSIEITSGRNAKINAVVTSGEITSLVIENPGEFYVSPPTLQIIDLNGKGRFAEYRTVVSSNGQIIGTEKINGGRNYGSNVIINVIPQGKGATAQVEIKKWYKNRYQEIDYLDESNGGLVEKKFDTKKTYAVLANPRRLRLKLNDNIDNQLEENLTGHSKIIGYAYDGNPIYGPYGYSDPLDSQSSITRLRTGYSLKTSRVNGPSVSNYPLGTFDEDYVWIPSLEVGKLYLDKNNGRYCVTPEYPNGVYAYFVTIDASGTPEYPYLIGSDFYSIPVDANYNSETTQKDIPASAKLIDFSTIPETGKEFSASIETVSAGKVSGAYVESAVSKHSPSNKIFVDNEGSGGEGVTAFVDTVWGKDVEYLRSRNEVAVIKTTDNVYLFKDFILRQQNTNLEGSIVGNVFFDSLLVLESVTGEFDKTELFDLIDPDTNQTVSILNVLLSNKSSFTANTVIELTDGLTNPDSVVATGLILESTIEQNTLRIKVISGDFSLGIESEELILQSKNLSDTVGTSIVTYSSISENISASTIDYNYAIAKTTENHNLTIGNIVNVTINPDDTSSNKIYYVRKRLYQEIELRDRILNSILVDSGIGSVSVLESGFYTGTTGGSYDLTLANATLTVTISESGYVTQIDVADKGAGFDEDTIFQLDSSEFLTEYGITQVKPAIFRINHVGLSSTDTKMVLSQVGNLSENDQLLIDNEVVTVTSVDYSTKTVFIQRGQEGTQAAKHFNRAQVTFYNFKYRFTNGSYIPELGTGPFSPKVFSYNEDTNILTLSYEYLVEPSQTSAITVSNFIRDESVDRKDVLISTVGEKQFKLEFSEDNELNFVINPDIDVQLYYNYTFDTSHPSMINTYLDFSPSINYNLVTTEKVVGPEEPGSGLPGSYVSLKLGFGDPLPSNDYQETQKLRFSNYYYFIKASNVFTDSGKLQVIDDPLSGSREISYVTNNKFVYPVEFLAQQNGTGVITYTTDSSDAVGLINTIRIENKGNSYTDLPVVVGVQSPKTIVPNLIPKLNLQGGIESIEVIGESGVFVDPQIIVEGNGNSPVLQINLIDNKINAINVINPGSGYTKVPSLTVIEKSNKIYFESNTIGIPKNIKISNSGGLFTQNSSTIPEFSTVYSIVLKNVVESKFASGVLLRQFDENGNVTFTGRVVKTIRKDSNIVRVEKLSGELQKKYQIGGSDIITFFNTNYEPELRTFYDRVGYFDSQRGILSSSESKLTDSYFYQDYSYVIRSSTPIELWRDLILDVVHPAGFKLFAEVAIDVDKIDVIQPVTTRETPVNITINSVGISNAFTTTSRYQITELVESVKSADAVRGVGRLSLDENNLLETSALDVYLSPSFDGYIDTDTSLAFGTKTFTILDKKSNNPVTPYNQNAIVVSLSGVIQEPGVSYTVSGNQITFSSAPLGPRVSEGQNLDADVFLGKVFNYTDSTKNQQYFKKVKNIFQRNGIWLDAANQIRSNRNFIVQETIGYVTTKYPDLQFNTEKCVRDIGYIVDSFESDLRFGGNSETVTSGNFYYNAANELDFINNELEETRDAYLYAAKLCAAAIRNWDVTFVDDPNTPPPDFEVIINAASDIITVPSTFGIVEGMNVSSGEQFPLNTVVEEIINDTTIRVSNPAFENITDNNLIIFTVDAAEVVTLGDNEYEFNGLIVEGELTINENSTVTIVSAIAKLRQITFSLSKINTGIFVDGSNVVLANKDYVIDQTIEYINTTYPGFSNPSEKKCRRDIGYLIDAIAYHLKFGGNNRLIDYAEKYYIANKLNYINDELTQTVDAFVYAINLLKNAVDNPTSPFTGPGYPLPQKGVDSCAEVRSALESYKGIYTTILQNGPNLILRNFGNTQRQGKYTDILTYSNYALIDDDELRLATEIDGIWFGAECAEVISALYTLHQSLDTILTTGENSVELSLPDYFNGKNTTFELYTEDNNILKTTTDEGLLVFINGVLQDFSAYTIIRSSDPNVTDKIDFSSAPKWDQNEAQLRLNQGTAVDYFYAFSIGEYQRQKINSQRIPFDTNFAIYPYNSASPISGVPDPNYCMVFINGVLQRNLIDYTIIGNTIRFRKKLNYYVPESGEASYSSVDIINFLGAKVDNKFLAFDFQPSTYTSKYNFTIYSGLNSTFFDEIKGLGYDNNEVISVYNGGNFIGSVYSYFQVTDPFEGVKFLLTSDNNPLIDSSQPLIFKSDSQENANEVSVNVNIIIDTDTTYTGPDTYIYGDILILDGITVTIEDTATVISTSVEFESSLNSDGNKEMVRESSPFIQDYGQKDIDWKVINKHTAKILEGDKILVDGEKNYRMVLSVPNKVISTQSNTFVSSRNKFYGNIITTSNNEPNAGSGLSILPILNDGVVTSLDYNRPEYYRLSLSNVTLPDIANGYSNKTYVDFIPVDGNGGGALAELVIYDGRIIGLQILDGGSGYTQPPRPVISKGFNIIRNRRNISSFTERDYHIVIPQVSNIYTLSLELSSPNLTNFNYFIDVSSDLFDEQVITTFNNSSGALPNLDSSSSGISFLEKNIGVVSDVSKQEIILSSFFESSASVVESQAYPVEVNRFAETFISPGATLFTPEQLDNISALVNITFAVGDNILYVTSTDGFADSGTLQVGTEIVTYSSKQPDRFIIEDRGVFGTQVVEAPVGTVVTKYLSFLLATRAPIVEVNSDSVFGPINAYSEVTIIKDSDALASYEGVLTETRDLKFVESTLDNTIISLDRSSLRKTFYNAEIVFGQSRVVETRFTFGYSSEGTFGEIVEPIVQISQFNETNNLIIGDLASDVFAQQSTELNVINTGSQLSSSSEDTFVTKLVEIDADDAIVIDATINTVSTESLSVIEPQAQYALDLSRTTEVTSIVERPEDVTNLSSVSFSDVVDASSVELTQAPEVPDDVSLINVVMSDVSTLESLSVIEPDSSYALDFSASNAVEIFFETPNFAINLGAVSFSDVVDASSIELTQAPEVPSDVSLINVVMSDVSTSESLSIVDSQFSVTLVSAAATTERFFEFFVGSVASTLTPITDSYLVDSEVEQQPEVPTDVSILNLSALEIDSEYTEYILPDILTGDISGIRESNVSIFYEFVTEPIQESLTLRSDLNKLVETSIINASTIDLLPESLSVIEPDSFYALNPSRTIEVTSTIVRPEDATNLSSVSFSDVVDASSVELTQAPEVPDDVSLINVALNELTTFESLSVVEPDSFYALDLSRTTEVTSIVERPEDVTNLSSVSFSDVVDASSVELTQAPEVPSDVSLINVALNQLTTVESISTIEPDSFYALNLSRTTEVTSTIVRPEDVTNLASVSFSDVVDASSVELTQAPEVPDDVSLINVALNQLTTTESLSVIEPDSFYALDLSRTIEVTSIVERPEDVTDLASVSFSDVVDASSVELTQAPEVPDDVSLINVALNQLTTFESVSIVETIDPVPLGNTLGRSQEITKIPEDIITNKVNLGESTVEISSEIDTDARTYGAISTEIDIDTIIDNGAIDQFNELIDPADIDINP